MLVSLRPHHVTCSIGFDGRGADDPFTANMTRIVLSGLRGPGGRETRVRITGGADVICAPCPKRRGLGCAEQERIDRLDAGHAKALGLVEGQILTWGEALDRARRSLVPEDLDVICRGCPVLPDGTCKAAIAALRAPKAGCVKTPA